MKPFVESPRRGRWVLLALAALFLAGIVTSFVLVQSGWRPGTTRNYGELVQPARPIADVTLQDLEGRPLAFGELKGKWLLMYFGSADCRTQCTQDLYKMRQITLATGQESHRVQPVFVITNSVALDALRYKLKDYPGTIALRGAHAAVRELASQFSVPAGGALDGLDRVYIVDPLGNLMMSYPADADPRGMLKDLRQLLRASRIG